MLAQGVSLDFVNHRTIDSFASRTYGVFIHDEGVVLHVNRCGIGRRYVRLPDQ